MLIINDIQHKSKIYYGNISPISIVKTLRTDGNSALLLYRLSQFFIKHRVGVFAIPVRYLNRLINSCWIGKNANFGGGLVLMHPYGVVINSSVKAGRNIVIQSNVVIGVADDSSAGSVPHLCDNIYIGTGAKILGGITIGNNVKIGANSVVIKDVPDNATVVGVPGKVLKKK